MKFPTTPMAAALLALAACGAQAAHLQLVDAATFGSSLTSVTAADGGQLGFSGPVDELSGLAEALAFGDGQHTGSLAGSGLGFRSEWVRLAALDASGATTRLQLSGSSAWHFDGTAELAEALEQATVGLDARLQVGSDGEAAGSAVRVRLQLGAESLFSSSVAGAGDTPTFSLLVQDSGFNTLASYNGVALNGRDTLDVAFDSAVGQTLTLSLVYANALGLGNASLTGVQRVESSALLDGTLSVSAVPEPQSVALLLAGLGVVGTAARRRRA